MSQFRCLLTAVADGGQICFVVSLCLFCGVVLLSLCGSLEWPPVSDERVLNVALKAEEESDC